MSTKPRRYFCLNDSDLTCLRNFQTEHSLTNLSDTLSALVTDHKAISERERFLEKGIFESGKRCEELLESINHNTMLLLKAMNTSGNQSVSSDENNKALSSPQTQNERTQTEDTLRPLIDEADHVFREIIALLETYQNKL